MSPGEGKKKSMAARSIFRSLRWGESLSKKGGEKGGNASYRERGKMREKKRGKRPFAASKRRCLEGGKSEKGEGGEETSPFSYAFLERKRKKGGRQ